MMFPDLPRKARNTAAGRMPYGFALIKRQIDTSGSGIYGLPRMADHVLDALLSALPNMGEDPTEHKRLR